MSVPYYEIPEVETNVKRRIAEAVAEERKACAKLADKAHIECIYDTFADLAAAIRARGEK